MRIPTGLAAALAEHWGDVGRRWLESLPDVVVDAEARWDICVGEPFEPGGYTAWAAPATTADGEEVVYKCVIPHSEAVGEAAALGSYGGDGAIRLLASEPDTYELLVERCVPGTDLWSVGDQDERLTIAADLMRRLWRTADTTRIALLTDVGPRWADITERRMLTLELPWVSEPIQRGAEFLRTLPFDSEQQVLIHGDFHPGNILAAQREPWLVIDPKPMIGEPAYDAVELLTQEGGRTVEPPSRVVIEMRIEKLANLLGIDAERIAFWALARSAEWSMWSLENGAIVDAAIEYGWARSLDAIIGTSLAG